MMKTLLTKVKMSNELLGVSLWQETLFLVLSLPTRWQDKDRMSPKLEWGNLVISWWLCSPGFLSFLGIPEALEQ